MKFEDAKRIAGVLKRCKPDPVAGTVGERVLWGRLAIAILQVCAELVPYGRWNDEEWRGAADMEPDREDY